MSDEIILQFEEFQNNGSMWNFVKGIRIVLDINKIKPLKASSWIPLPKGIKNKKAVINPENYDQKCFLWCVGIHKILEKSQNLRNPGRITKKLKNEIENFNLNGMEFPCGFRDIDKFEKNNKISINLFGYDEKTNDIDILRVSKEKQNEKHVDLLLINNENGKHYCLIKNLERLVSKQVSNHGHKIHICYYCLQYFKYEKTLKDHLEYCEKHECVKTNYPKKGETLKFKNYEKMHDIPFVIYADFECNLKPIKNNIGEKTTQFQKHEPSGYCYLIKCFNNNIFKPKLKKSQDENISLKFVKSLEKEVKEIYKKK